MFLYNKSNLRYSQFILLIKFIGYRNSNHIYKAKLIFDCALYSCGVLLYYLLVGKGPFDSSNYDQTVKANYDGQVDLTRFNFTNECINLLKGMLDPNPQSRYTLDQVKQSSFFKRHIFVFNQVSSQTSLGSINYQNDSQNYSPQQSPYSLAIQFQI